MTSTMAMTTTETTPHPAVQEKIFTTVFRANVDGTLLTRWYEGIECRPSDLLETVEHHAFMYKEHMEYTTCDDATEGLLAVLGPVHKVEWGCYYSDSSEKKGWFRPECTVVSHPLRSISEKAKNMWSTPGGVFLILFLIFLSMFALWWIYRCHKVKRVDWFWRIRKDAYKTAQYTAHKSNNDESDEDVDVFTNSDSYNTGV